MKLSTIARSSLAFFFTVTVAASDFACTPPSDGLRSDNGRGGGNNGSRLGGNAGNGFDGGVGGNGGSPFIIEFADALEPGDEPDAQDPTDALEECGLQKFDIKREPPDVMIVLDRSGSMMRTVDNVVPMAGESTRWEYTTGALDTVLHATENDIAWGVKMYPTCFGTTHNVADGSGPQVPPMNGMPSIWRVCEQPQGTHNPCAVAGLETAPALSQSMPVSTAVRAAQPRYDTGATPTAAAVNAALETLQALNRSHPKYMLLATDGAPTCGDTNDDTVLDHAGVSGGSRAVAAVKKAHDAGVPVFVLGIAIDDPSQSGLTGNQLQDAQRAHATLNALAEAGGRARSGDLKYYPALSEQMLAEALASIAADTISCVMPLEMPPPEDAVVAVDVDGKRLPESQADGWSFTNGKKAIRFNGVACQKLQKGEFKNTEINFGCPGKPLPQPPPAL